MPLAGDFDGDGRIDDLAVLRAMASGATWFFDYNRNGSTDAQIPNWGKKGDLPVAGDLAGGGQVDDLAVIRSPRTSLRQVLAAAYDEALQ